MRKQALRLFRNVVRRIRARNGIYITGQCPGYASGLGNKMLAIAAGLACARRVKVPLVLEDIDGWGFNTTTGAPHYAPDASRACLPTRLSQLFPALQFYPPHACHSYSSVFQEQDSRVYTPVPRNRSIALRGYFFSESYFGSIANDVREAFTPDKRVDDYIKDKYPSLLRSEFWSVHIRLGDYVAQGKSEPLEYFTSALTKLRAKGMIVVFSDSPGELYTYVEFLRRHFLANVLIPVDEPNFVDLRLMNYACGHVLSDSSFGFWGAYLSNSELSKGIVAPSKMILRPRHWEIA